MIFQNFIKGGTERSNYGQFEYPKGADLIFDFGNPACTIAYNSSHIVYNVGSANVTGSLIPFNNPSPTYPVLTTSAGGAMVTRFISDAGALYNYLTWDWKSTQNQTNVLIVRNNGAQLSGQDNLFPQPPGANSITLRYNTPSANYTQVSLYDSSNTEFIPFYAEAFNGASNNGRDGWNMFSVLTDGNSLHDYYLNPTIFARDTTSIVRTTSGLQTNNFAIQSNAQTMAFLQYPFVLSPKQIRQIYKVFSQRFFT